MRKIRDHEVSTKTVIAYSNLLIDIGEVFHTLDISKTTKETRIELMYYQQEMKGMVMTDRVMKKKKSFRNAVNVIVALSAKKRLNFKVSKNGKFQITGCKSETDAIQTILNFIMEMQIQCSNHFRISDGSDEIRVAFQTVMTNIDFSLGFCLNRQRLDELINQNTPYNSLLETSFGYTGVNIKFPVEQEMIDEQKIHRFQIGKDRVLETTDWKDWVCCEVPMNEYIVHKTKKRYNTFLVFHSGNVIMSGMTFETMEPAFDAFQQIISEWQCQIEEVLDHHQDKKSESLENKKNRSELTNVNPV